MNEFSLINTYFKSILHRREDVVFGIGDDAACLEIPAGMQLLVSTDTLVADVHFLSEWDAYDIAYKAVMVNISDIAAMGGEPCWMSLALTLPALDEAWLKRFSQGLRNALSQYNVALIGGDTTRGPLSMTLTIHGLIPAGCSVRRSGASPGDKIYVSGTVGAAALAVANLKTNHLDATDKAALMAKLLHPKPRVDLNLVMQAYATAAIDISDGLSADLCHICEESNVGATIVSEDIPIHPLVKKYQGENALDFALGGGDDYELCFTVATKDEGQLLKMLAKEGLGCYCIGVIDEQPGLRAKDSEGKSIELKPQGYSHF
jgi:thiamine-monophosphate kinase